ncbi:MAG TPA: hypothetical protein VET65_00585 [Candidatus Limnocylindrales bacterium]|nr:hypothetical protein [Candidatus Limnocylindrales bacterium]
MSDRKPDDDLQVALGRMIGLTAVTLGLLLGGGILLILAATALFRFLYGG